jgi:hypothetical protein
MSGPPAVGAEPVAVGELGVCITLPVGWQFDSRVGENALMSHADLTTADWTRLSDERARLAWRVADESGPLVRPIIDLPVM